MTDLVTRLRDFPVRDCCSQRAEAADRIEQLTNERDKAARLGKSGGYKATPEHSWAEWCDELYRDLNKANDRIEQLEAALRPFAAAADTLDKEGWDNLHIEGSNADVTGEHCRAARAALEGRE